MGVGSVISIFARPVYISENPPGGRCVQNNIWQGFANSVGVP
jgi:hypothetical protein